MIKRLTLIVLLVSGLLAVDVKAQGPFAAQIQQAIAQLISGVTPFTDLGVATNGYINFGTGRSSTGYGFRDNSGSLQFKNSATGSWNSLPSTAAPSDAKYITQVPNTGLSNEQALSALSTGLVVNATATGVLTAYAGTACTNQFPRSLSAIGAATCAAISLTADVTGTLPATSGGTGQTVYAIGDLLYAATTTTLSKLAAVATGNVLISGGVSTAPSWGKVGLATHVSGFLPPTNGGTGQSTTATANRYLKGDGTNWGTSSGSASGTGTCIAGTSWVNGLNSDAAPTCLQPSTSALSDVSNGTWTPVIGGSGGTAGQTYGSQEGRYVRTGKMVYASFSMTLTGKGTITTAVQIQGLPFTSAATTNGSGMGILRWSTMATSWINLIARVNTAATTATIFGATATNVSDDTSLTTSDISNTTSWTGLIVYEIP